MMPSCPTFYRFILLPYRGDFHCAHRIVLEQPLMKETVLLYCTLLYLSISGQLFLGQEAQIIQELKAKLNLANN